MEHRAANEHSPRFIVIMANARHALFMSKGPARTFAKANVGSVVFKLSTV